MQMHRNYVLGSLRAASMGLLLAGSALAQVDWELEVRDLATSLGIPNVMVEGRTSRVHGLTDADGKVTLAVGGEKESVIVHGRAGYSYSVGEYRIDGPKVVYLVPDAMFHKTPLIPKSGTTAPIVFQGTTQCILGPNPYTIEVEVPSGVLPEAASFWIAPVPAYAGPAPANADTYIAWAVGQFAIRLLDANGREIVDVLPSPGITVRASPTWYPYSHLNLPNTEVSGTQYRLTKTSAHWDGQPDRLTWVPADGMYTAHLRACSWWVIVIPFLVSPLGSADAPIVPAPAPPPPPQITISAADCVTTSGSDTTTVSCGVTSWPVASGMNGGITTNLSAQFTAGLALELGIAPSNLASVWTRLNFMLSGSLGAEVGGGVSHTCAITAGTQTPGGSQVGPRCYNGEFSIAVAERTYTVTCNGNSVQLKFPERMVRVLCLTFDHTCGTELNPCVSGPPKISQVVPGSLKICEGDALACPK